MVHVTERGQTKGLVKLDSGHTVQQTDPCLWPPVFVAGAQEFLWFSNQSLRGALKHAASDEASRFRFLIEKSRLAVLTAKSRIDACINCTREFPRLRQFCFERRLAVRWGRHRRLRYRREEKQRGFEGCLQGFLVETSRYVKLRANMNARLFVVEEGERCVPAYIFQKADVEARPRVTQYLTMAELYSCVPSCYI